MYTFRRLMFAVVVLAAATPAFAQNSTTPGPRFSMKPLFSVTPTTTPTTPTTPAPQAPKQQGLGIFVQGGYTHQSLFGTATDSDSFSPQGFIAGIGFGGNKSGAFGVGVDVNYMWTTLSEDGDTLKTQSLDIPVYGRFNIGGHNTKNAFTVYIPFGWFFDVNLSAKAGGDDVKDFFDTFQTGPLVGAGFEVYRMALEARGQWSIKELAKDGPEGKQFTFIVLFKVRLN